MKDQQVERAQEEYKQYENKKAQLENAGDNKKKQAYQANRVDGKKAETPYYNKQQKRLHQVAKGMQSRIDQLEKKEKPRVEKGVKFHTKSMESLGNKTITRVEHAHAQPGEKNIYEAGTRVATAGEKPAITGRKGSGKTTRSNHTHEKSEPTALKSGYSYQQLESLDNDKTIIENP